MELKSLLTTGGRLVIVNLTLFQSEKLKTLRCTLSFTEEIKNRKYWPAYLS